MLNKINEGQIIKWLLVVILVLSAVSLFSITWFKSYISEVHMAMALPVSILAGLSAVAVAIIERK